MPIPGPDTRVVELRVPGLIGTSGESLLDSVGTVDVAGDGVGRVIRPSDRLRRPAPGPVLQALGRSLPRTLEGYLWSGMTSGGAAKATWALLFPFSLSNVAHWMLPPVQEGRRLPSAISAVCAALLRLAALLLTMLLVSQLAVISLDLFAAQCLAPGSACLSGTPSWLRESDAARLTVGVLPVLLVVLILHRVSAAKWSVKAPANDSAKEAGKGLPGATLDDGVDTVDTVMLRCLHLVGALGCVSLLLLGGPLRVPSDSATAILWWLTLGLLACTILGTAVRAHRLFTAVTRGVLLGVAVALLIAAAVVSAPLPRALPGTDDTVEGIGAVLLVLCVLFALLLVPAALLARPSWSTLPRRLRPWAGGWAAAPTLVLACLLGGGFGAGLAIALRRLLGAEGLALPESYTLITLLWGGALVFAVLVAVFCFAVALPLRKVRRGIPDIVKLMETSPEDEREAAKAWAGSSWERKYLHRIVLTVVLAMSAGVVALLAVRFGVGSVPSWLDWLSALGVFALGALAAALLRAVYTAATGARRARHLGAFSDLVCFWPRAAHPAAPPSYAAKVVPELAERTKEHLKEPGTRVVLAGYHIGGLLAVLTASRLAAELPASDRERVGVLTAGAPLQWGYQRAFPAVFPHDTLARLYGMLDGRWRGLCRGTDTFGGGATTWRHQVAGGKLLGVGYLPDGNVGALEPAVQGPTGALVLGGDHWLPDPMRLPTGGRRWVPGIRKYADYVADPEWDRALVIAAGLEGTDMAGRLAEQVPLFGDLLGQPPRNG
ncbi:hypothetical protein SAMN05421630_111193 [Prauserella marina]|uniref:Uncharacterized protein n=1 Tax=Prauserella marina TaxID=530584 RepID=A0A1G6WZ53_9PSEU|nr:hypothetical protein [Prauserella marina]PWV73131.1 hypothetical protein DES30_10980 [Prauserella marina]SDD71089.1 hypothetical protein SAMN05421630_111193 [Prauserella marina]